jgi:two-component system, NtrC family, response regulator HydG
MDKKKGKILIVDDNSQILSSLKILLKNDFEEITAIRNPNMIPGMMQSTVYDIILLDMNFNAGQNTGNEGIFWLREILKKDPLTIVIMITAYGDIDLAVKAIKDGATDFIAKPWDAEKLIITLKNALELRNSKVELSKLRGKQNQLNEDIEKHYQMYTGISVTMQGIYKTIDKVAQTDANILVLGENGTGKELIAREIHRKSKRAKEIFLSVDIGSLTESLFESELFGYVKGAFTDAKEDRAGRFETASGGTLFMDEIGNLPLSLQSKLLTVLQNRQVTRIGSNKPVAIDIRLITATNKSLENMVHQNLFREDLFYRINTIQIEIPPIRERQEDIAGLADFFLAQFACKYEKPTLKISSSAYDTLKNYIWPGNIRELKHTIEKAVILSDSNCLEPNDFYLKEKHAVINELENNYRLSDIEKKTIENVLEKCKGNVSKAAQILDISRTTLYSKIEKYGLM